MNIKNIITQQILEIKIKPLVVLIKYLSGYPWPEAKCMTYHTKKCIIELRKDKKHMFHCKYCGYSKSLKPKWAEILENNGSS